MFGVKSFKKSFTLIELLIVVIIIGILASAMIPKLQSLQARGRDTQRRADMRNGYTALYMYRVDNGQHLPSFNNTPPGEGRNTATYSLYAPDFAILTGLVPKYLTAPIKDPLTRPHNGSIRGNFYVYYLMTKNDYTVADLNFIVDPARCNVKKAVQEIAELRYYPEFPNENDLYRSCPDGRGWGYDVYILSGGPKKDYGVWLFDDEDIAGGKH